MEQTQRKRRRRFPPAVFAAAQDLADGDARITYREIAEALATDFVEAPQESSIRDWFNDGRLVRRSADDYWRLDARTSAEEGRAVLSLIAWMTRKASRPLRITRQRADWIARLAAIAPEAPPAAIAAYAQLYNHGGDTLELDQLLGADIASGWEDWPATGGVPIMVATRMGGTFR